MNDTIKLLQSFKGKTVKETIAILQKKEQKAFTDLEQSKKLAKILSFKSADAFYDMAEPEKRQKPIIGSPDEYLDMEDWSIPCWSLAALLNILKDYQLFSNGLIVYIDNNSYRDDSETPVDACVNMIITLHEHKLFKEH